MIRLIVYTNVNGTDYDANTPTEAINVLEKLQDSGFRIKLAYGDRLTGEDWGETHDIVGYVGRSTGRMKVPLLVYNKRSTGGGAILTANIVKIEHANKIYGGVMWEHPNYHRGA